LERDQSLKTRFAFWRKRARHKAAFKGRTIRVKREVANDPARHIKGATVPKPDGSETGSVTGTADRPIAIGGPTISGAAFTYDAEA
jgi:hypothetical protein